MKIAIFGASGNIGYHILTLICSSDGATKTMMGDTKIVAVTRDPECLTARLGENLIPTLSIVKGDVTDVDSVSSALVGVKRAFLCLPQALSSEEMKQVSRRWSDAAAAQGVETVIRVSSLGIDGHVSQGALGGAHLEGESYAKSLGMSVTSIRPTSFSSNFEKYDLDSVRQSCSFASPLGTEAAVNWISTLDIAAVSLVALLDPSWDGKVLEVTGPPSSTLTATKMADVLSDKMASPVTYTPLPLPEGGDFGELWAFLRAGGFDRSTGVVKQVTGRDPVDFAVWVEELLAK